MSDTKELQDLVANDLADRVLTKAEGDTLISANALRMALADLGMIVGLQGIKAYAEGNSEAHLKASGMAVILSLHLDALDLVIARGELESL